VRDTATGVALLKINASGLPTTSLMRAADATPGMVAWEEPGSEPGSQIIFPTMLVNISSRASTMNQVANQVPSEQVMRRFLISGRLETKGGGAVWNDAGELVGLLESEEGSQTVSVIPASDVASTLHEFLSNRRITHATLNLKTTDLAHVTIDNVKRALPLSGNLVVQTAAVSSTLQLNDVIERIERDPLDGTVDLGERLLDYRPGATITISGLRKEKSFQTTVTLGSVVTGEGMK
jgi:S1-C subfamily serine protease